MSAPKRKRTAGGPPNSNAERQARLKQIRVDVFLPPEVAEDFALIVAAEAGTNRRGNRTQAIVRAIRELATRLRKKDLRK